MEILLIFLVLGLLFYQHVRMKTLFEEQRNDLFKMEGRLIARIKEQQKEVAPKPETKVEEVIKAPEITITEKPKEEKVEVHLAPTSLKIVSENVVEISEAIISENLEENELKQELEQEQEDAAKVEWNNPEEMALPELGWMDRFKRDNPDLERFIGENLISKIGIAILVLGIAFFVKYAIDKDWINEVARTGIGVLAGAIVLGFAHYLRAQFKAFSSVLVAGGISIFYFTLTIAFQDYQLFSQSIAFVLLCVVTLFSVVISLNYNRQELAILSLIGGYASPLMVSTGEGNYIVLFSYLLVLDASLLAIAFYRNWTLLNAITYGLTVMMYGAWLQKKLLLNVTEDAPYIGAILFASAFYLVFTFSNLINQIKEKQAFKTLELSLIVSNSFLYFTAGFLILDAFAPNFKGLFAIILSAFNLIVTYVVVKNQKVDKNLFYLMVGLTLTFITLAIPIQFSSNYITMFWAAEAALLLWLSQKSGITLYRFVSVVIMILSGMSLVIDWSQIYGKLDSLSIILNEAFLASIVVCTSTVVYYKLLTKDTEEVHEFLGITLSLKQLKQGVIGCMIPLFYLSIFLEWHYHINLFFELKTQVNAYDFFMHLVLTTVFLTWLKRKEHPHFQLWAFGSTLINLVCFITCFSFELEEEFYWMLNKGAHYPSYTYWIHLLCYIPFIYQLKDAYFFSKVKWPKPNAWMLVIVSTYILSKELQWQLLFINLSELLANPNWYNQIDYLLTNATKVGYPILWSVMAFLYLSFGIKNGYKPLRMAALSLIGFTVLKLFVYDIRNVSEGGKIAAFILLGIVLLIISFTYQKIKAIIIDGEEQAKQDENTVS